MAIDKKKLAKRLKQLPALAPALDVDEISRLLENLDDEEIWEFLKSEITKARLFVRQLAGTIGAIQHERGPKRWNTDL